MSHEVVVHKACDSSQDAYPLLFRTHIAREKSHTPFQATISFQRSSLDLFSQAWAQHSSWVCLRQLKYGERWRLCSRGLSAFWENEEWSRFSISLDCWVKLDQTCSVEHAGRKWLQKGATPWILWVNFLTALQGLHGNNALSWILAHRCLRNGGKSHSLPAYLFK